MCLLWLHRTMSLMLITESLDDRAQIATRSWCMSLACGCLCCAKKHRHLRMASADVRELSEFLQLALSSQLMRCACAWLQGA